MTPTSPGPGDAWTIIERERRHDRTMKRIFIAAWAFTFAVIVLAIVVISLPMVQMVRLVAAGGAPWITVLGAAMPLIGMLWTLALLVAALSTVGMFLRQRTASLTEIQLRLATLEQMLASKPDADA